MHKKVICVITAISLTCAVATPVFATPNLTEQQSQLNKNKNALQQVQQKRNEIESQIEVLDSKIEKAMNTIDSTNKKIKNTEQQIETTQKQIDKAQEEVDKEQELYNKRVRAMYINGADTYLEVILSAESFSDLISRVDTVKEIIKYDKDIIDDLNGKKEVVESKQKNLNNDKQNLLSLKSKSEKELAELNKDKKEQSDMIAKLEKQENEYGSKIASAQKLISQAMTQINTIRKTTPAYTPSRGSAQISSNSIVAYASNFLGTPYVWGGTSPSGFDCSGFVQYVYAHFGVSLPRVAASQAYAGTAVSRDNLQPGDLVYFGSDIHHIGIYVGNGCYIHAPHTGDVVKISPLSRSDYAGATRVK